MRAVVKSGWFVWVAFLAACGGRVSGPEGGGGPGVAQTSGGGGGQGGGSPGNQADAAFEVCPNDPPDIGTSCDLSPNAGCAYFGFQGVCESFVCVAKKWQSANGDGC